jgi:hypothetical protein
MTNRLLTFILVAGLFACNAPEASEAPEPESSTTESAHTAKNAGAVALLASVQASGTSAFLACRTAAGVSPKLEITFFTSYAHIGAATVKFRRSTSGGVHEWVAAGTLDGIPRAGDLQGSASFTLGAQTVAFDYFAELEDDANEITIGGLEIPFVCNAVW